MNILLPKNAGNSQLDQLIREDQQTKLHRDIESNMSNIQRRLIALIVAVGLATSVGSTNVRGEDSLQVKNTANLSKPFKINLGPAHITNTLLLPPIITEEVFSHFVPEGKTLVKSTQVLTEGIEIQGKSYFSVHIELVSLEKNRGSALRLGTIDIEAEQDQDDESWGITVPNMNEVRTYFQDFPLVQKNVIPLTYLINPKGQEMSFAKR